ncbi:MAG TPA: isoamylase early set domain-containing protein [Verrucomicrobiota bacterium]|nr:glycoside hydrolase family 13 [Verrucomicrobiales bacterium]HRI14704.1 isoamylase early set domain-containing protein [Verrucomicrobiota bacterium]
MTIPTHNSLVAPGARLEAKTTIKPVNFLCVVSKATSVSLVGDFNGWDTQSHPMRRHHDGSWQLAVPLRPGAQLYQFHVDGEPVNDPRAQGLARNCFGDKVSLIFVG